MIELQNGGPAMSSPLLQDWYKRVFSRIVDLVGDFAGDETFIIEGDSLLLHCFSNPKLDFAPGFQVLHATYMIEQFLQKLRQRKCTFEIIFFKDNSKLCIPHFAHSQYHNRYLVAREAMIHHLSSVSCQPESLLKVRKFDDFASNLFEKYLADSGAYLVMCHDGALPTRVHEIKSGDDSSSDDESTVASDSDEDWEMANSDESENVADNVISSIYFRQMIYWFFVRGYNVSLINNVEFRDTKVMTMIIEGAFKQKRTALMSRQFQQRALSETIEYSSDSGDSDTSSDISQSETAKANSTLASGILKRVIHQNPNLTQRQCVVISTLATMFSFATVQSPELNVWIQAMLLHITVLQYTQLSHRVFESRQDKNSLFFDQFLATANQILGSREWQITMDRHHLICDLFDLVDGRMFFELQALIKKNGIERAVSSDILPTYNMLACAVEDICHNKLQCGKSGWQASPGKSSTKKEASKTNSVHTPGVKSLLPFKNKVFDVHLKPVHIEVDETHVADEEFYGSGIFDEMTHWHNSKPLDQKKATPLLDWEKRRALRRNDRYMTEMRNYADSLTGSAGMSHAEIIVVEPSSSSAQQSTNSNKSPNGQTKPNSTGKGNAKATKQSLNVRQDAASKIQLKATERQKREIEKWKNQVKNFDGIIDAKTRFKNVNTYLTGLSSDSRRILEPQIVAYIIDILLRVMAAKSGSEQAIDMTIMTRVWENMTRLLKIKKGVSSHVAQYVERICVWFGLPILKLPNSDEQALSFSPWELPKLRKKLGISEIEFQLIYGGPFMDRSIDSMADSRTPDFDPDGWQRDVLDQIDARKSVFVVAPTSAGKTFISFYAMRQVLKEGNDGILVYVAPTKALVNQIAAEVQARFRKTFHGSEAAGKSVWAIHTRDHRINDPTGCQILVTVPHVLQIMLLAPHNSKSWTPLLKRIIFDEVHCIGQSDDGVVWEQLLLLAPCPIIALSATVGNPQEFHNWLQHAQKRSEFDMKMIQHEHRYSDLRKYVYHPPKAFSFRGLNSPVGLAGLGLDDADHVTFIHPVLSLIDRPRGMPDDFSLEPRDCLSLWKGMQLVKTDAFSIDPKLDPSRFFAGEIISKQRTISWQQELKIILKDWMKNRESPFETLIEHLGQRSSRPRPNGSMYDDPKINRFSLLDTTLPLICSLHASQALPALFFNYDRMMCQDLCEHILKQLEESEAEWKEESEAWRAKIGKWKDWQKAQEAAEKRISKAKTSNRKGGDDESMSRAERMKDSSSSDRSEFASFNPERPLEKFSLADYKKLSHNDFMEYAEELKRWPIQQWAINALGRGIGVHHAGMNRKYRQVCEILFRKGFLRVVIATGTLALGINMPCKTVVFSGDSLYLTALNFRQAAGRAGRRGFDLLGNVVFQQVPTAKVHRLISSKLPDLHGHFPLTTSLVLRLLILLHGSDQAPSAVRSIDSVLANPRMCLGGAEMKETVLHFLRFSIEYLRRNRLIDRFGAPLNLAGCVSHLYYTESSSFALHALLRSKYLQHLCGNLAQHPNNTTRILMLIMSHIFGRRPLRKSTLEAYHAADKRASSVVLLPPLPKRAAKVLQAHDKQVLGIYTQYVATYINQHKFEEDCVLPFSNLRCGGDQSGTETGLPQNDHLRTRITSPFHALSGYEDKWNTVSDLCETVRSGVWIEESVVPFVPPSSEELPLNAYLYDFFRHGNVHQLEIANGIRPGDVWYLLNDFSMVLATLVTSLENFVNPGGAVGADMLDVIGGGDLHHIEEEDQVFDKEEPEEENAILARDSQPSHGPTAASSVSKKMSQVDKGKVVESWEDEMDEEVEEDILAEHPALCESKQHKTKGRDSKSTTSASQAASEERRSLLVILTAFKQLRSDFDEKFKGMWA
ncbi:hypothetical protein N7478_011937 [Penicillium angulare]|uniref:uncharacterized protein n=1 Tax=Penicillium angulare TaxID=116970 RepID=UPI002541B41E|nr:uncharacterized protein N7478_011937 [Penicillium angulare]KAJ5261342.1 hypothetical protein N7478_011937 [Penicillium angulare]